MADASGFAYATLLLGDKDGTYTVEAISPLSNTNVPARFTASARTPATVRIARRDENMVEDVYMNPYVVLPLDGARLRAIGYDASGGRIGPVRVDWKTSLPKNAPDPGAATLAPAFRSSSTSLSPTAFGSLSLDATTSPRISGVSTAKAPVTISTSLFVDVDGTFVPTQPVDDLPNFVPGARLDGTSVPPYAIPGGTPPLQGVALHILTPPSTTGSIRFKLINPSQYQGVAMNWPSQGAIIDNDMYFLDGSQQKLELPAVPFDPSGNTSVMLHVNDYAARATLEITVTPHQRAPFTIGPLSIPKDMDGNLIPDAGWKALASSGTGTLTHVPDAAPGSVDNDNTPLASGLPAEGITGDGLVLLEEYRGFVVRGSHRRLNPAVKDLFVVIEPIDDSIDNRITELPVAIHEVRPYENETLGDDVAPEINPNRALITGAQRQRGLRARNRLVSPQYELPDFSSTRPADFYMSGFTFSIGDDLNLITQEMFSGDIPESTNSALVVEVFNEAFVRHWISYGPDQIRDTPVAATDNDDPAHLGIYGGSDRLQSFPTGDDDFSTHLYVNCQDWRPLILGGPDPNRAYRLLTTDEVLQYFRDVFFHEVAHGLSIEHDTVLCSPSVMRDDPVLPLGRPLTTGDKEQIRIHVNQ